MVFVESVESRNTTFVFFSRQRSLFFFCDGGLLERGGVKDVNKGRDG